MQSMDNKKVIAVMEKLTLHKYLEKLLMAKMSKVTLFPVFSQTGAPNISEPVNYILIEDLKVISSLNTGAINN
ncbi:MAG: hypothetical protein ABH823_00740 [bacterium]